MYNQELQNRNITISSIEQKTLSNGSIMTKVTDEDGKKYSFFNTKKDGSPTAASEGFLGISIGDIVEIGYVEEEKEFAGDKGQVKYTQRTIRALEKVEPPSKAVVAPGKDWVSVDDTPAPF